VSQAPLLEIRQLRVRYSDGRRTVDAIDDVSFDVFPGETVGLVGESGSGKSTLANAILGLVPIAAGEVRFAGQDVVHLSFKERRAFYRQAQIVFQDPYSSLNPVRTIGRILAEPLEALGHIDRAAARVRVHAMLARVGLPQDAEGRYPREFSGGQRQRIAIARALMPNPRLVICDEATSALDLSIQAQILNVLQDLQAGSGLSYLFVSHDLEVVKHMCNRIIVLYRGRVMESGTAASVFGIPAHPYTHALREAAPVPNPRSQRDRRLAATGSKAPALEKRAAAESLCPFAPRCAYVETRCWSERPLLQPSEDNGEVACHRFPQWRSAEHGPTGTSGGGKSAPILVRRVPTADLLPNYPARPL
jgi:oligopeptide/dipeptide ABC transporter ATP-binding protein